MVKRKSSNRINVDANPVSRTEGGVLANLWRTIIVETRLLTMLNYFLDRYTRDGGTRNRSTIKSYFEASEMTWKTLLFLLFKILRAKKVKVSFVITFPDDKERTFSVDVLPPNDGDKDDTERERKRNTRGRNKQDS